MKKVINFLIDFFSEPKCKFCGESESKTTTGLGFEPIYVCLNKNCKDK